MIEVPIHEYIYMDLDAERMKVSFRVIVAEPEGNIQKWKYIYAHYWADEPWRRRAILDGFMELFVMFYDNGYNRIVDYFMPRDTPHG